MRISNARAKFRGGAARVLLCQWALQNKLYCN
jgi:hypothetical protein